LNCNHLVPGSIICLPSPSIITHAATTTFRVPTIGHTQPQIILTHPTQPPIAVTHPPATIPPSNSGNCNRPYVVKAGDTCWYIANQLTRIGDARFYALNQGINCHALHIGQVVCLEECTGNKVYCILNGDTCFSIWTKVGISSSTFHFLNPQVNCNALRPGDFLNISRGSC
jgi:hypothetical protein